MTNWTMPSAPGDTATATAVLRECFDPVGQLSYDTKEREQSCEALEVREPLHRW